MLVLDSLWEHGGGRRANVPERALVRPHGRSRRKHRPNLSRISARHREPSRRAAFGCDFRARSEITTPTSTSWDCSTCSIRAAKHGVQKVHLRVQRSDVRDAREIPDRSNRRRSARRRPTASPRWWPNTICDSIKKKRASILRRCATGTSMGRVRILTARPASSRSLSENSSNAKACASTGTASRRATTSL